MPILGRLQSLLDERGISYTHHVHATAYTSKEVAALEHLPQHRFVKAVVLTGEEGYVMAALPADYSVDMAELRAAFGLKHARLATEKELGELFPDCELGAMPPVGKLYGLPTYVESGLADEERIAFNAGTHRDVVYLQFRDFEELAEARPVHFARLAAP